MKIGILGTGTMARTLGGRWAAAGHDVLVGGRSAAKAQQLATALGARSGSLADAAQAADVTLLAVAYTAVPEVLDAAGAGRGALTGKVVVDCTNPVELTGFSVTSGATSLAEQIQQRTGARVVKAFNLCEAKVWQLDPPAFDGRPLVVPFCGDDEEARATVGALIEDLGCAPLAVGDVTYARHLEAMAALVISLLFRGHDPYTVFNLVTAADEARGRVAGAPAQR
ncbi:NAD(P)-binding domain-containing protein [Micromonospora sp. NPDC049101]|uniref:NADPH-dependent F420 reductase n=1 Tax=unclassified Micromonospora TaxID=2617518 RepID=UPI00340AFA6A